MRLLLCPMQEAYDCNYKLMMHMTEDQLSYKIIGLAIDVHRHLGPGLLESLYERALARDLAAAGLSVKTQCDIPYVYKDISLDCDAFRADIVVNNLVVLEIKSVKELEP